MQYGNPSPAPQMSVFSEPDWVVVIAAGTGGPQALAEVLPRFPADFTGTVIVVQHMRPGFTRVLADQLNHICKLRVHEPADGQELQHSRILMVPGSASLLIETLDPTAGHVVLLDSTARSPELRLKRADTVMTSAATAFGKKTIGVLLTGVGSDGCEGLRAITNAGGVTIVQDEPTSVVHDLPASAIRAGVAHEVLPLWSITDRVIEIMEGATDAVAA